MKKINSCSICKTFTLKKKCEKGHKTVVFCPPKYSPTDKYGDYRRKTKKEESIKKGLV